MKKILIIDGNNFYNRMFFACKSSGANNYFEFLLNKLIQLKNIYNDCRFIFAFDTCKSERRLKLYPEYKGHRKSSLEEHEAKLFKEILATFVNICKYSGCIILEGSGYEADDYIACITQMLKLRYNVTISSTDKDLYQLIEKFVTIFDPLKNIMVTNDNFENIMEMKQEYFIDYKCMVGDISDNIKGIDGIGDKTAKKLISTYGSYENIVSELSKLPKLTKRENDVILNKEIIERNRKLMDLRLNFSDKNLQGLIKKMVDECKLEKEKVINILAEYNLEDLYKEMLKLCLTS